MFYIYMCLFMCVIYLYKVWMQWLWGADPGSFEENLREDCMQLLET
jgi:hypothetical protein